MTSENVNSKNETEINESKNSDAFVVMLNFFPLP